MQLGTLVNDAPVRDTLLQHLTDAHITGHHQHDLCEALELAWAAGSSFIIVKMSNKNRPIVTSTPVNYCCCSPWASVGALPYAISIAIGNEIACFDFASMETF